MVRILFCIFAFVFSLSPSFAQQRVEVVSRVGITNAGGQFIRFYLDILNKSQNEYEFVIAHIPGSGGEAAYQRVLTVPKSILFSNQSFFSNPKNNTNNRVSNFEFIGTLNVSYAGIMVNPNNKAKDFNEFIEQIRMSDVTYNAGSLNSSGGGPILAKLLEEKFDLDVKIKNIMYKNVQDRVRAVAQGEATFMINNPASANVPQNNGALRVLVMGSPFRIDGYEDIPTTAELGYPELTFGAIGALSILKSEPDFLNKMKPFFIDMCKNSELKKLINNRNHTTICLSDTELKKKIEEEKKFFVENNIEFGLDD